MNIYLLS